MDIRDLLDGINIKQALMFGIVLAVLYYALLFNDGSFFDAQIRQAQESAQRDRIKLEKVEKALIDKERFEKEIGEIHKHMKDFQSYFPVNYSSNELVSKVSKIAEKNGLTIVNLKPSSEVSEFKNYPETGVDFTVEGEYHLIMNFVAEITQLKKAVDFKEMNFKVAQQGEEPRIRLETTLVVYSNSDGFGVDNG